MKCLKLSKRKKSKMDRFRSQYRFCNEKNNNKIKNMSQSYLFTHIKLHKISPLFCTQSIIDIDFSFTFKCSLNEAIANAFLN